MTLIAMAYALLVLLLAIASALHTHFGAWRRLDSAPLVASLDCSAVNRLASAQRLADCDELTAAGYDADGCALLAPTYREALAIAWSEVTDAKRRCDAALTARPRFALLATTLVW